MTVVAMAEVRAMMRAVVRVRRMAVLMAAVTVVAWG